jgi:hypothetical protein
MAEFYDALANYLVWPTAADHHGDDYGAGAGLTFLEQHVTKNWYNGSTQVNRVISGFALPSSGSATNATITAGTAMIAGYLITGTDNIVTVDFTNTTSYVYLALVGDGTNVTQPIIYVETSRIASTSKWHLLLGTVTAAAGTISGSVDMRTEGRHIWGAVTHSDGGTSTIANAGSANWAVSKSGVRSVITYDIAFQFRAPCAMCTGATSSLYSVSTTTALFDANDTETFYFHIMG